MENKELTGFETSTPETDQETGKISWDVKYKADYALVYKRFKELNKALKDFVTYEEVRTDPKLMEVGRWFNTLYNTFRTHIRREYPKQFKQLQTIDESLVKELIRKSLGEESATGAGAGAATFTPGEGANYATPNAFNPNKKAKGAKNIYYYKLGFKPVPKKIKGSGLEVKQLWEEDILNEVNEFQQKRLDGIDEIEKLFITPRELILFSLTPMLKLKFKPKFLFSTAIRFKVASKPEF